MGAARAEVFDLVLDSQEFVWAAILGLHLALSEEQILDESCYGQQQHEAYEQMPEAHFPHHATMILQSNGHTRGCGVAWIRRMLKKVRHEPVI